MKKLFVLIFFILFSSELYAHENCIEGYVFMKNGENKPIIGATVRIMNTSLGAITNSKGFFHIKGIPKGNYELIITGVGFKPIHHKFTIEKEFSEPITMNFEMEETAIQTADVVVTATRSEKIYEDAPIKVSVINTRDFIATSSVDIKDGLNFQPGVRTENNCQNCGFSQVRINGLDGRYSQILIDGNAIFSSLNGVYGLEQMPSSMIDRIEVIRGGSSLFGGNAIAGIINIILKEPYNNSFNFNAFQSFINEKTFDKTFNLNGSIISENQNFGSYLFGFIRDREGWDENNDSYSDIGKLNVKTYGIRSFYRPNHKSKISLGFQTLYHFIRGGDKFNRPPHLTNITEQASHNSNFLTFKYEIYLDDHINKITLNAGFQNTNRDSYYGSGFDPNAYGNTNNRTFAASIQYDHFLDNFLGYHIFTFGYEFHYDWMKDEAIAYSRIINQKTSQNGIFMQDDWNITDELNLIWGLRLDKHNKIDELIFSPRANLLYKLSNNINLRASISTGYRPPQAFDEDLHITQVGGEGLLITIDKNLRYESSISYSSSLDFSLSLFDLPIAASIEGFYTKLSDVFVLEEIGRDANNNLNLLRTNGEDAFVYGANFELQAVFSKLFDIKGSFTIQNGYHNKPVEWSSGDENAGIEPQFSKKIFKSPNLYGYFVANINPNGRLNIALSGILTGSMYLPHYAGFIEQDVLVKTKNFFELNSKIAYKLIYSPNIEINLGVNNIFNAFQSDLDQGPKRDSGYIYGPARPRTAFVGLDVKI